VVEADEERVVRIRFEIYFEQLGRDGQARHRRCRLRASGRAASEFAVETEGL
jgi:hypothetical protein